MAEKGQNELIGRAIVDRDFRNRLLEDPEKVIEEEGYEVSDEVLQQIKAVDPRAADTAVEDLNSAFAERKAAG